MLIFFAFFSDGLLNQSTCDLNRLLAFPAIHRHGLMDWSMCPNKTLPPEWETFK